MIKQHLKQAGLNSTEAEIYLTLYEYQRLTPAALVELTGIKRTTIYAAADELVKKGLASIEHGKYKRFYVVRSSDSLSKFLKNEEKELASKKEAIENAIKRLDEIPRAKPAITPKVRVITDTNVVDFLYSQTPVWEKNMKEVGATTWWGFQDHSFVEDREYQEWILWYWKRAPRKIDLKLLSNDSEIEKEMKKKRITRRKIKFWDGGSPINGTHWILGDYIVSIVTQNKRHHLIQTHDPIMSQNMRELYKYIWKQNGKEKTLT